MKLSIITINRNNKKGLAKTLKSVTGQSVGDFEYIVVDGASTDGSADLLHGSEYRISRFISEKDSGIYSAMNKGVRMASGEYLLFLNSGDILHDTSVVENILPKLESGEDIITGKMLFSGENRFLQAGNPLTFTYFYNTSLPHDATFIKRQQLLDTPYDESLRIVADWKFFVQAIIIHGCSYKIIDNLISEFDTHGISRTNLDLLRQERESVLKELFPERLLNDFDRLINGDGYRNTDYDRFYISIRGHRSGKLFYRLNLMVFKFISLFKKSSRFSGEFSFNPDV